MTTLSNKHRDSMSDNIEGYDVEIVDPQPLTGKQAKALDKRIRAAADKLSTATDNLLTLLEEAAAGEIHVALGIPSWTYWFKDAIQITVADRFERKVLVGLISGKGVSQAGMKQRTWRQ